MTGNTTTQYGYYPNCHCKEDGVWFICSDEEYNDPPQFQVVTHDKLQDITGSNETAFYLNTNEAYRVHRYERYCRFGNFCEGFVLYCICI